jgi:two-component system, cell cycle sensor histidine kinase PleC
MTDKSDRRSINAGKTRSRLIDELTELQEKFEKLTEADGPVQQDEGVNSSLQSNLFQKLIDAIPAPVYFKNRSGVYLGCNTAFGQFLGLSREDIIGHSTYDMADNDLATIYKAADEELFLQGGTQVYEAQVTYADKSRHEVMFHKAVFDAGKSSQGLIGIILDISERKKAEEALSRSEEAFRTVAEIGNDWLWETGVDHKFINYSGYREITGLPIKGATGVARWENASKRDLKDKAKWSQHMAQLDAREKFRDFEFELRSDPPEWIRVSGNPVFDEAGKFKGYRGTAIIVTRRKRAEEDATKLISAFDTLGEIVAVVDADGRYVFCNEQYRELNRDVIETVQPGLLFEDHLKAMAAKGLVPEADGRSDEWVQERMEQHRNPGEPFELPRQDGMWLLIHSQKLQDGGSIILGTDITALKRAQQAQAKSEMRFRDFTDSASDWLWEMDDNLRFSFVSDLAQKLAGVPIEKMIGMTRNELVSKSGERQIWAGHLKDLEAHRPFRDFQYTYVHPDGEDLYFSISGNPIFDEVGKFTGYRGTGRDITERKAAEQALLQSEERFSGMTAIATEAIIATNEDLKITVFNKGAEDVFGYSENAAMGQPVNMLLPERFRKAHLNHINDFIDSRDENRRMNRRREVIGLRKDGSEFPASASIAKLRVGHETILTVMLHDITERNLAEAELIAAKERAEYADRAKSQFLANMSHELRTPLNAILGFSQVLAKGIGGKLNATQTEYINAVHESGEHLLGVVNDILDISKLGANKAEIVEKNIFVPVIVDQMVGFMQLRAAEGDVDIRNLMPNGLPVLRADERILKQMLLNLLSNAVKFTESGGKVTVTGEVAKDGSLGVSVTDNGIGISVDDIPRAMSMFGQVDSALDRKFEGTGLGLPLVQSMAQLHGGSLEIDSEPGVGTRATIWFPMERVIEKE